MPSDSGLDLQAGVARRCARAIVGVARAHHVVAAARGELGPTSPNEVNAPGGGVTAIASLVRGQVREVLHALEVDSREVVDQGYQQRFPTPSTA